MGGILSGGKVNQSEMELPMLIALKQAYEEKIRPVEEIFINVGNNDYKTLYEADMLSLPTVLVIGGQSVGKTTAINYLMKANYCGSSKNTDRFIMIAYGTKERVEPTANLATVPNFPYPGLKVLDSVYCNSYVSITKAPILRYLNIIDTPGYNTYSVEEELMLQYYENGIKYFAERAEVILLVVDAANKNLFGDIQDMLNRLGPMQKKVIILINKSHQCTMSKLHDIRTITLSKLQNDMGFKDSPLVFVGSFSDNVAGTEDHCCYFQCYLEKLYMILKVLPVEVHFSRFREVMKRALLMQAFALTAVQMCKQTRKPRNEFMYELIQNHIPLLIHEHSISEHDVKPLRIWAEHLDLEMPPTYSNILKYMLEELTAFINEDLDNFRLCLASVTMVGVKMTKTNANADLTWSAVLRESIKKNWQLEFRYTYPFTDKLRLKDVDDILTYNGVSKERGKEIWDLVDADKDGLVNENEYCLLRYFLELEASGGEVPQVVSDSLRPPPMPPESSATMVVTKPRSLETNSTCSEGTESENQSESEETERTLSEETIK